MDEQTIARFWSKVDKTGDCWLWTASKSVDRYGFFALTHRKQVRAHRFSWEISYGPVPRGMCVCHTCDVRHCVRPSHLWLGTNDENMADMVAKGRATGPGPKAPELFTRGERHGHAKLTEADVLRIRALKRTDDWRPADLARELGVSTSLIFQIVRRRIWTHLP